MRVSALVLVLALAGCGHAVVPAAQSLPSTTDAAFRTAEASKRTPEYGGIWVGGRTSAALYDAGKIVSSNGKLTPSAQIDWVASVSTATLNRSIVDESVGSDGTL